jgi:putative ABC transport system permease protein
MRLYRALLRLYPASFRAEYGSELCRVFAQRHGGTTGLGAVALWIEDVADVVRNAGLAHLDVLRQDLRYAARAMRRAPGFAATAILVTALGIGANTAAFSITDRVLIRPLPYPEARRLVKLWERLPEYGRMELSPANYRDWRRMSTAFEAVAAYSDTPVNLVGEGDPLRLDAAVVTADLLPLLGVEPLLGRSLTADDDRDGAPGTVLLSYGLWRGVFGGDPNVVGRSVRLDDEARTIVGVLPAGFHFPSRETQLWMPIRFGPRAFEDRDDNYLECVAKLKPGVSLEQARAEMAVVTHRLERQYPRENAQTAATVNRLGDEVSRQARLLLAALFGASFCVLLIACTNLASLLLARAAGRRKELSVRTALGAGRERLVRQLLTEALILASLGGLGGVMVGAAALPLLSTLVPATLPVGEAAVDLRVMAFAALLTVLTGLVFGIVPALRTCHGVELGGLREGGRAGLGGRRERLRSVLVVAEVVACVVLLIAAGLLIRALARVQATEPGFRSEGVLAVQTPLPMPRYETTARRSELYSRILSEVRALPGVSHAAYATALPLQWGGGIWSVRVEGAPPLPERSGPTASLRFVTPGYFAAMGIPLLTGRDVAESDGFEAPFVAVVSESFVRQHWPGQEPLGRRFSFALRERLVVGVAGDVRVRGLERESEPQVYVPYQQVPDGGLTFYAPKELVVRAASDPAPLAGALRRVVRKADPELPVAALRSLGEVVDTQTAPRRTQLRVLGAFAALALLLAGVGIHGLLSYAVSQRTSEFGLRLALGARGGDLLGLVLRQGLRLAGAGGLLGLPLAYAAARGMEALLAGVRPGDPATFLAATLVALLTTLSGSLVPAVRALRVDPTSALRVE